MSIGIPFNPGKSFAFVRVVKTVAMGNTVIRPRQGSGVTGEAVRAQNMTPEDIAYSARKKSIEVLSQVTPQDRLIDLII